LQPAAQYSRGQDYREGAHERFDIRGDETGTPSIAMGHRVVSVGTIDGIGDLADDQSAHGRNCHLEGEMNGPFLIVLGLIWTRLRLGPRAMVVAFWMAIYGTYANRATTCYAGFVGAGKQFAPISAADHPGTAFQ
jgi:hydroxylaminobenzene mutase